MRHLKENEGQSRDFQPNMLDSGYFRPHLSCSTEIRDLVLYCEYFVASGYSSVLQYPRSRWLGLRA